MERMKMIFISLRPKQWVKNLFVFAALLFSGNIFIQVKVLQSVLGFIYFCLISSAVYLMNDVIDRHKDKLHPLKSKRPIALGKISPSFALSVGIGLTLISLIGIAYMQNVYLLGIICAYFFLNVFYSTVLKNEVILDVISIALGFELRVWAGAVIIDIEPSVWLQVCTFLLALFIGFAKRREERFSLRAFASEHRGVLSRYRIGFLDQLIAICGGVIILAYSLYTLSPEILRRFNGKFMIYTVPFVVYGVFRYLYLMYMHRESGDPTEIITSDIPLIINLALWLFVIILIIYV